MGTRFRKSINLGGGVRINFSKSGVGYSWGTKGYRITKTAKGTMKQTVSIPGTGVSHVTETKKKTTKTGRPVNNKPHERSSGKGTWKLVIAVFFFIGAVLNIGVNSGYVGTGIFFGLIFVIWWNSGRKKNVASKASLEPTTVAPGDPENDDGQIGNIKSPLDISGTQDQ